MVNRDGVVDFEMSNEMRDLIKSLHNQTTTQSGFFAETWSTSLYKSLENSELLSNALSSIITSVTFPNSHLGNQLKTVSKLIATHEERGVDTDMFYVEMGGVSEHLF